jgi:hypothetical protein
MTRSTRSTTVAFPSRITEPGARISYADRQHGEVVLVADAEGNVPITSVAEAVVADAMLLQPIGTWTPPEPDTAEEAPAP